MSARFAIKEYTKRLSMMVNLSDDLGSNPANAKIIFSAVIVIKFKHTTFWQYLRITEIDKYQDLCWLDRTILILKLEGLPSVIE